MKPSPLMRSWVEKLRWGLVVGGVLLLLLLAGILGYRRYQALRAWHRILERTGASLTRETNGFTYSQSVGGRTIFTLHAARAVQAKDGKYALHDVALTLYRPNGQADRIYGSEFEYDQKTGVARALGPVHMDLQAPGALGRSKEAAGEPKAQPAPDSDALSRQEGETGPETIHVKTSGLVYVRNLGVAATDQDVEFRYAGLQCHSRGAEFNSGQSTVHLLADVQLNGQVQGQDVHLTADRADLDRLSNIATLRMPRVRLQGETAASAGAVLHLRPDGLLQSGEANGSVRVTRGTGTLTAEGVEARLTNGTTLQDLRASGGVTLSDEGPVRPLHGRAASVHVSYGVHGEMRTLLAEGAASMEFYDRSHGAAGLRRQMSGERIEALFAGLETAKKAALSSVKINGQARLSGESYTQAAASQPLVRTVAAARGESDRPVAGKSETFMAADELVVDVVPGPGGKPQAQGVHGAGNTLLEQHLADGANRRSTGDRLLLRLGTSRAPGASKASTGLPTSSVAVNSAVQEGHVTLRSVAAAGTGTGKGAKPEVTEASAQRADFEAEDHRLTLTGQARLHNEGGELSASQVDMDTESGEVNAQGKVLATLAQRSGSQPRDGSSANATEATHIAATTARYVRGTDQAEFRGADAQPVRLWQGGSQIEAATLLLDRERDTLTARPQTQGGVVRCVFAGGGKAPTAEAQAAERPRTTVGGGRQAEATGGSGVLRVISAQLDYAGANHEAIFGGGVRTSGLLGEARSRSATVFLRNAPAQKGALVKGGAARDGSASQPLAASPPRAAPADLLGGSVERVVLTGRVQLEQPGRSGTGEQLLYTSADSSFVLTGTPTRPPHIVDAQQGSVTGATLLFRTGDNTVVVANDPSHTGTAHGRVRTELNLQPQR